MLLTAHYFMGVFKICKGILDRVFPINYNLCFLVLSYLPFYLKRVKFSRYSPVVTQRLGRGIALLFHDHDIRRG